MKNWRALIIIAGILALISVFMMFMSFISDSDSDTLSIPAGASWYYYEFYLPSGGNIDVDFQEVQGTSVTVYLLNTKQYNRYVDGQPFESLYSYTGSSGQISETVDSSDTYYLVFTHGAGATSTSQSVSVDFKMNGFDLVLFSVGIILLIVAAGLAIYGSRLKKEDKPPWAVEAQKESDVLMFDR
jgi:hypothetical protein